LSLLSSPYSNYLIRQFVLLAVTKISSRSTTTFPQQERISQLLAEYTTSPELELQQRAVEFASLFSLGEVRGGVLERMPPPELKATVMGVVSENKPVGSTKQGKEADLLGDEVSPTPGSAVNGQAVNTAQTNNDLLAEIFGGGTSTPSNSTPAQSQKSTVDDILGLFGSSTISSTPSQAASSSAFSPPQAQPPPPQPPQPPAPRLTSYTAYEKNELKITLTPQTSAAKPGVVVILARFQVTSGVSVTDLNFQAAVPKSQQLQMLPMSNPDVHPGAIETQQMRVIAPPGSNVRLRLRISFTVSGRAVQDQVDFSGFPPGLTGGS